MRYFRFEKDVLEHITNETGKGKLKTYIHRVFPWTDIQAAHREMEENKNM
jgi:NADPH:quinone reductase-like Zn-dependent oxidoreductase